jgi:hypothetical protein
MVTAYVDELNSGDCSYVEVLFNLSIHLKYSDAGMCNVLCRV